MQKFYKMIFFKKELVNEIENILKYSILKMKSSNLIKFLVDMCWNCAPCSAIIANQLVR